jgi:chromobox protein 8
MSDVSLSNPNTFEVEAILRDRVLRDGTVEYKIRWKGYEPEEDTWEVEGNLHCPELLEAYLEKKEKRKKPETRNRSSSSKPKPSPKKETASKRRRKSTSSDASSSSEKLDMNDVFDKAPSTPPRNDDEEVISPSQKKTKQVEEPLITTSSSPSKEKHKKKKSKRDKSESREPTSSTKSSKKKKAAEPQEIEDGPCSSKSAKKDKKKKKRKEKDDDDAEEEESSTKKAHEKKKSSKEKTSFISSNNNGSGRVPPLILIMGNGDTSSSGTKSKSNSPNDNICIVESPAKNEPLSQVYIDEEAGNQATVTLETPPSSPSVASNTPVRIEASPPPSNANIRNKSVTPIRFTSKQSNFAAAMSNLTTPVKNEESEFSGDFFVSNVTTTMDLEPGTWPGEIDIDTTTIPSQTYLSSHAVRDKSSTFASRNTVVNEAGVTVQSKESESSSNNNISIDTSAATSQTLAPTVLHSLVTSSSNIQLSPVINIPISKSPTLLSVASAVEQSPNPASSAFIPSLLSTDNDYSMPNGQSFSTPASDSTIPLRLTLPDHSCFGDSCTIYNYAKKGEVHNVNQHQICYVYSKNWKLRCLECTEKCQITDETVAYVFCLITVDSVIYMIIKLKHSVYIANELFLIEADKFKKNCPTAYANFVTDTEEYFSSLGDLGMAIDQQKEVVVRHHEPNGILYAYNNNDNATFQYTNPSFYQSEKVREAMRDIVQLFLLELQFDIGRFMAKCVDVSDLYGFVMQYYEKRDRMYIAVKKETVEQSYEVLYNSLIVKPSNY